MLVLGRRRGQILMVGDIRITIVDIKGDQVRLGIGAPLAVPVHRLEVYEAIKREGQIKDLPHRHLSPKDLEE